LVAALAADAERSLGGGVPVMTTLVGERGAGKSRLLAEAAALARRVAPAVTIARAPGGAGPRAVLVDDAHRAGDDALDAIEAAAAGAGPLWVVVTAVPSFDELRPRWGRGAWHH